MYRLAQLTPESWIYREDRLLDAYRDYIDKGTVCHKRQLVLGALVNAVYTVAHAALSALNLVLYCATFGNEKISARSYTRIYADLSVTSFVALFRFKPMMEKLRVAEAASYCRTLLSVDAHGPITIDLSGKRISPERMKGELSVKLRYLNAQQLNQALALAGRTKTEGDFVTLLSDFHTDAKKSHLPVFDGKIAEILKRTSSQWVKECCLEYYLKASKRELCTIDQSLILAALEKSPKFAVSFLEHYLAHHVPDELINKIAQKYYLQPSDDHHFRRAWENCANPEKKLKAILPLYQMSRRPLHNLHYYCPQIVTALLNHARDLPYEPLLLARLDECIRPRIDAREIVLDILQLAQRHRLPLLRDRAVNVILINAKTLGPSWLELQPDLIAQALQETGGRVTWDPNNLGQFRDMHEVYAYYAEEGLTLARYAAAHPGTPLANACQDYIRRNPGYLQAVRTFSPQEQQMLFQPLLQLAA